MKELKLLENNLREIYLDIALNDVLGDDMELAQLNFS